MSSQEIDLTPSELKAIEIHKYYLSEKEGREVPLEEAIVDFLINYETDFLRLKQVEDLQEQNHEILKYKWIESEKEGHDIGTQRAAEEWIRKYGSLWRKEKESLERNGFIEKRLTLEGKGGASIEAAALARIARARNTEIYLHKVRMRPYNFLLFGRKPYLNVKSVLCPVFIEVNKGEVLELIATGGEAEQALKEAGEYIMRLNANKTGRVDGSAG